MSGNPYEQTGWRQIPGGVCRPGGLALTAKLVARGGLVPGAAVLDMGCGTGEAVAWLWAQGYAATGLDCSELLMGEARRRHPQVPFVVGDALRPPFPEGTFDGVLLECTLSLLDGAKALDACRRMLRPGGRLLLSDVYSRAEGADCRTRKGLERQLSAAGFRVAGFEDCGAVLGDFLAQMLMDGAHPCALLGCDMAAWSCRQAGYCLLWAEREGEEA